jgi:rubredoxin---NAD+ reductase
MSSMKPLVIIGAGLAGWTTVREFRKLDSTTPITVISQDRGDFYAKPSLSNAFAQKRLPSQLVSTTATLMVENMQVTLLNHSTVTALDTAQRCITLQRDGQAHTPPTTLEYSQLVLATGAQPLRIPLQGDAATAVQSINTLDDFSRFFSAISPDETGVSSSQNHSKTILIMGAGLIGCEFANDLALAGHRVHVADPSSRPLSALLPETPALQLAQALQTLGVHWHWGRTVQRVDRQGSQGLRATLSDGSTLAVDAVLSAVGLRADTSLASAAGLVCERGIVVNTQLQTSAPAVFALGDCAQYASAGARTLPYVMPIMNAAKALAQTLAGKPTALVFPLMPVTIKTPALPIVVSAAAPSIAGQWLADTANDGAAGAWRFVDEAGAQRGFVLTGSQTSRRMELAKSTVL